MTIQVILKLDRCKEIRTLSLLISASNLVNLMSIDRIWSLVDAMKKQTVYFQYHLYCQRIHDKSGDIEIGLMQRN